MANFDPQHPLYRQIAGLATLRAGSTRRCAAVGRWLRAYGEGAGAVRRRRASAATAARSCVAFNTSNTAGDAQIEVERELGGVHDAARRLRRQRQRAAAASASKLPPFGLCVCEGAAQ